MDLKEAYKVLGVPETASREEVEKQYAVWARRDRARKRAQSASSDDFDFDQINLAYKTILNHYIQQEQSDKPEQHPLVEKLDHFWTYYKMHVIIGFIVVFTVGYFINLTIENQREKARLAQLPPADVTMMMFGDYVYPDLQQIEEFILTENKDWQRVAVNLTFVPSKVNNPYDVTSQQKAVITLLSDRSDVYMIDRNNFQNLVNQGLFMPLDEYKERLRAAVGEDNLVYTRKESTDYRNDEPGELHLYTVRIPKQDIYNARGDEVLVGIHMGSENIENALRLIEFLASQKP